MNKIKQRSVGCRLALTVFKSFIYLFILTSFTAPALAEDQSKSSQKVRDNLHVVDNVVVIVADDLGYTDLGCFGSTFYETPNLDALAASGVSFTNAYASCPVCSPTRASLLTGLWPQRSGVTDYLGAAAGKRWKRNTRLLPAEFEDQMSLDMTTFAERAKRQSMATFFAGKWHLGGEDYFPEHQGYDFNLGGIERGGPYGGDKYFSPYGNPRLKDGPNGEHLPDRLANETVKFIKDCNKNNTPFVAHLSFYSVHTPLMARAELLEKYKQKRQALIEQNGEAGVDIFGYDTTRAVRLSQDHAIYAGMVEAMDEAVGKVLNCLADLKLDDRTLVIFTSDNGGLSTSEGSPTSNMPLRAGKGWMYEGGIRVPMIVRCPGATEVATKCDVPVSSIDIAPTLAEVLDHGSQSEDDNFDGISLAQLWSSSDQSLVADRPLFWCYPHYGNQGGAPAAAIRVGDWKLIRWFEEDSRELYNLRLDIGEQYDLVTQSPEQAAKLAKQLDDWMAEVSASLPTDNPSFDPQKKDGRK